MVSPDAGVRGIAGCVEDRNTYRASLSGDFFFSIDSIYSVNVQSVASTELLGLTERARSDSGSSRVISGVHSGSSASTEDDMTAPVSLRHSK